MTVNKRYYPTTTQDIKKVCEYCRKEFVISQASQEEALKRGGKIDRKYCNECLLRWRKGEIDLESYERKHGDISQP